MKPTLQLKLTQHLALTPQLQQSIRLLQLSTLELAQEVERMAAENPFLERAETGDDTAGWTAGGDVSPRETTAGEPAPAAAAAEASPAGEAAASEREAEDWLVEGDYGGAAPDDDEDEGLPPLAAAPLKLRDHLREQLALLPLTERDHALVALLIDMLDDDGYLTQTLDEIAAMIPVDVEVDADELADELAVALARLQSFDPIGVGARNAGECLALQLAALPAATPGRAVAVRIVREHLPLLAARESAKLKRAVDCDEEELRAAQRLIRQLNPRPAAPFAQSDTRFVVPDVVVRKVRGAWTVSLNAEVMPKVRVNRMYADALRAGRGRSQGPLAQQLQEARWLVKNIRQRFDTIRRVAQAIIDRQRQFLEHGEVAMRPLVMREIADVLGLHESTISRVTTQKYLATPRGIFELKYFFGSHVATEAGGTCSATAIRALIRQLVAAENATKPLSDARIAEILGGQGIVVARRTVAKYREALHIPPVSLRKAS